MILFTLRVASKSVHSMRLAYHFTSTAGSRLLPHIVALLVNAQNEQLSMPY